MSDAHADDMPTPQLTKRAGPPDRRTLIGRREDDEGVGTDDLRALIQAESRARERAQDDMKRAQAEMASELKRVRDRTLKWAAVWSAVLVVVMVLLSVFGRHIATAVLGP